MDFALSFVEKVSPSKLAMVFHSEHGIWKMAISIMNINMCSSMPNASITLNTLSDGSSKKKFLEQTLAKQGCQGIPIYSIPVGHLEELMNHKETDLPSVLTAPFDPRKRIDLAIRVVAQAHEQLQPFSLIFMERVESCDNLCHLIQELGKRQDYIHLRGHADLQQIYPATKLHHHFSVGDLWFDF